jgi:hypothetical protein
VEGSSAADDDVTARIPVTLGPLTSPKAKIASHATKGGAHGAPASGRMVTHDARDEGARPRDSIKLLWEHATAVPSNHVMDGGIEKLERAT